MAVASAIIAIAATATTAILGGISAIKQGEQQAALYKSQAKLVSAQGQMKDLQARQEAAEMQTDQLRLRSKQIAQAVGAGVTLDSESFLGLVAASASQAEKDRQQVLRNGRISVAEAQAQAGYYKSAAATAKANGWWTGMTSILTGFGQAGMQMAKAGWFEGSSNSISSSTIKGTNTSFNRSGPIATYAGRA